MEGPALDWATERTLDALENIAAELERIRLLKEHELGVEVRGPDPHVRRLDTDAGEE